jgi:hypothetical protein
MHLTIVTNDRQAAAVWTKSNATTVTRAWTLEKYFLVNQINYAKSVALLVNHRQPIATRGKVNKLANGVKRHLKSQLGNKLQRGSLILLRYVHPRIQIPNLDTACCAVGQSIILEGKTYRLRNTV